MTDYIPHLAAALLTIILCSQTANAATNNLRCKSPFVKVQTYNNAIKCKKVGNFPNYYAASLALKMWRPRASCNAHSSPPTSKILSRRPNVWRASMVFTCAIIN